MATESTPARDDGSSRIKSILDRSSVLPLLPMVALGALLYWQVTSLVEVMRWVDHTDLVIANAHEVESVLLSEQNAVRGFLLTHDDEFLERYRESAGRFGPLAIALAELVSDNPPQVARMESIRDAGLAWEQEQAVPLVTLAQRGEVVSVERLRAARLDSVRTQIGSFIEIEQGLRVRRIRASGEAATRTLWVGVVAIAVLAVALVLFIRSQMASVSRAFGDLLQESRARAQVNESNARALERAVDVYGAYIERLAQGDLGATMEPVGEGQLLTLGTNLRGLGGALESMVTKMREAVSTLASGTSQILATTQEQSATASETAAAISQTVATVEEVSSTARQAAERAQAVSGAATRSVAVSNAGRTSIAETIASIDALRTQVDAIAARILGLAEQASTVDQIIGTVNEIAEQSNMLAINASIEAARSGEAGKSFLVVAREVRALAEQSKEATARVRSILGEVQRSTTSAVMVTEQGTKAAERAVAAVRGAGQRMGELTAVIEEALEAANVIVGASNQQVQGVSQIAQAMMAIRDASSQAVEGTRQTERAAAELNAMASQLRETAAQFHA